MDDADISPEAEADSTSLGFADSPIKTRKFFPETFIWDLLTTG